MHRAAPSAVVAAAVRRGDEWDAGIGVAGRSHAGDATAATIFDLASVTKPFTALLAARLARRGVPLGAPLGALLPEARGTASEHATLELLLAHRAGLDGHRPLYAPLLEGREVDRAAALRIAADARRDGCSGEAPDEGFPPVYSDLGYLLVGEALARACERPLDELIDDEVVAPLFLGVTSARGLAPDADVAPTEAVDFRGGVVRGVVHDENAFAMGGLGACGHAGLFGAAADVLELGATLVEALADERPTWLRASELQTLLRRRPGGTLRAGFDGKSAEGSSAGARFGRDSFGHLGFTGTSLWIDPTASLVGVLLSNRVHPTRANDAIKRARPAVHDGVFAWATAGGALG
ncbi:MAG: beta-lactamase family protein [Polyangiaceae bacterium]|nr:beta-lactamase family protein [Polyangiaceae bacterium]